MESKAASWFGYWLLVVVLVGLGYLAALSIGGLFWYIAAAMIVLSPFRSRPRWFRTGWALLGGYLLGYLLVAPFGCTSTQYFDLEGGVSQGSGTVCRSLIGIEYTGPDPFTPDSTPAVVAGIVLAAVGAAVTWRVQRPVEGEGAATG